MIIIIWFQTTLMSSTNAALPKISYIKSIDVFLGTCFVMVFAALLEYATVGYVGKRIVMRKTQIQQLAKLSQEHRNKCAAAAAAAQAFEGTIGQEVTGPILCPSGPIDGVPRPISVKPLTVSKTFNFYLICNLLMISYNVDIDLIMIMIWDYQLKISMLKIIFKMCYKWLKYLYYVILYY